MQKNDFHKGKYRRNACTKEIQKKTFYEGEYKNVNEWNTKETFLQSKNKII